MSLNQQLVPRASWLRTVCLEERSDYTLCLAHRPDSGLPETSVRLHALSRSSLRFGSASKKGPIPLCLEPRFDSGLPETSVRFRSVSTLGPIPFCLGPRSDSAPPRTSVRFRSTANLGPVPVCLEHRSDSVPLTRGPGLHGLRREMFQRRIIIKHLWHEPG